MSDLIQGKVMSEEEFHEIKALKAKIYTIENREKKSIEQIKLKFTEIYKKFKEEINKKIDFKDQNIHKSKMKIAELEIENKKIVFITNEKHLKEKTELENVILKQEELIENLYNKNENLIKTLHDKNKEINNLKFKLSDEEFINRKNRVFENSVVGAYNNNIAVIKNFSAAGGSIFYNLNESNALDLSMINKIGEVEYFKSLNRNLHQQMKGNIFYILLI